MEAFDDGVHVFTSRGNTERTASYWLRWGCSLFPELCCCCCCLDGLWCHLAQVQRRLTPRHRQRVWREALVLWPKKELGEIPLFFLPSSSIPVCRQSWGLQVQLDRYPESQGRNLLSCGAVTPREWGDSLWLPALSPGVVSLEH